MQTPLPMMKYFHHPLNNFQYPSFSIKFTNNQTHQYNSARKNLFESRFNYFFSSNQRSLSNKNKACLSVQMTD